jgi:hypothetical protein
MQTKGGGGNLAALPRLNLDLDAIYNAISSVQIKPHTICQSSAKAGNSTSQDTLNRGEPAMENAALSDDTKYSMTVLPRQKPVFPGQLRKRAVPAQTNRLITTGESRREKYKTIGYKDSQSHSVRPKPGLELKETGQRTEILIHPGVGFVASIGCINPCTSLPNAEEMIDFVPSRERVIAIINDLKDYSKGTFPTQNGERIANAFVVIDGEP